MTAYYQANIAGHSDFEAASVSLLAEQIGNYYADIKSSPPDAKSVMEINSGEYLSAKMLAAFNDKVEGEWRDARDDKRHAADNEKYQRSLMGDRL